MQERATQRPLLTVQLQLNYAALLQVSYFFTKIFQSRAVPGLTRVVRRDERIDPVGGFCSVRRFHLFP